MKPYETFKLYRALRFHFHTDDYDYFVSKGRIRHASPEQFEKSKERYWATVVAEKYGPKTPNFLLSNLSEEKAYITKLATDDQCDRRYQQWSTYRNATSYHLKNNLKLLGNQDDEFLCDKHTVPKIFQRYVAGEIDKDTLAIIIRSTQCLDKWNEDMRENSYWNLRKRKLVKYVPFVPVKPKYSEIILDKGWDICYNTQRFREVS